MRRKYFEKCVGGSVLALTGLIMISHDANAASIIQVITSGEAMKTLMSCTVFTYIGTKIFRSDNPLL